MTDTDLSLTVRLARGAAWGLDAPLLRRLAAPATPGEVQDLVSAIPMNFVDGTCWSVRQVLQRNEAMCIEGAFVAAAALQLQGRAPLLVRLFSSDGIDHVVALFLHAGRWGAISKGGHLWCRWRDPVYADLRELMMSYVHEYVDGAGVEKTLVGYSDVYDLRRLPPSLWVTREDSCIEVDRRLGSWGFYAVRDEAVLPLRQRDALERLGNTLTEPATS